MFLYLLSHMIPPPLDRRDVGALLLLCHVALGGEQVDGRILSRPEKLSQTFKNLPSAALLLLH